VGPQGIGRWIAQAVLGAGGALLIGDLDTDAGRACLDQMEDGPTRRLWPAGCGARSQCPHWIAATRKRFGHIDWLVNNAGIADPHSGKLTELSLATWNRYLASRLTGAFLGSKHALPALIQARGSIVNIASTRALQSEPDTEAYASRKGGLLTLTHAMAISAGPGVRVNAFFPGWIVTDDWRKPSARCTPSLSRQDHAKNPVASRNTRRLRRTGGLPAGPRVRVCHQPADGDRSRHDREDAISGTMNPAPESPCLAHKPTIEQGDQS